MHADLVGQLKNNSGNLHALSMTDALTKIDVVVPIPDKEATTVVPAFSIDRFIGSRPQYKSTLMVGKDLSIGFPVSCGLIGKSNTTIQGQFTLNAMRRWKTLTHKAKSIFPIGGPHSTMDSFFASHPAAPDSNLGVPVGIHSLDVVEIN